MKRKFLSALGATVIGLAMLSSQSFAQQKTTKECQEEWRANKAANQSNGLDAVMGRALGEQSMWLSPDR